MLKLKKLKSCKGFKEIWKYVDILNIKNRFDTYFSKKEMYDFISQEYYKLNKEEYKLPQDLHPFHLQYQSNNKFGVLKVKTKDDEVWCVLKNIGMYPLNVIRNYGMPLSKNNNLKNSISVLKILIKNNQIRETVCIDKDFEILQKNKVLLMEEKKQYTKMFYSKVQEDFSHFNKSKWRSKHKINIFNKNKNFTFTKLDLIDEYYARDLYEHWCDNRLKSESVSKKQMEKIFEILKWKSMFDNNDDDLIFFTLKYKKIILGIIGFVLTNTIKTSYQCFNMSLSKCNKTFIDTQIGKYDIENYLNNISDIMFFKSLEYLYNEKFTLAYVGTTLGLRQSLKKYKSKLNKHNFEYYRYIHLPLKK